MIGRFCIFIAAMYLPVKAYTQFHSTHLIQTKYSKKIVRLVHKKVGHKVGSGTGLALLQYYEKKARARTALKFALSKKALPYIAVGDELYFSGTYKNNNVNNVFDSRYVYNGPMHYAIVVGIKDETTLIIAHQNPSEEDTRKSKMILSELIVEDSTRLENINVYGLWPKKTNINPKKILRNKKEYGIHSIGFEKKNYFAGNNTIGE